MSDWRPIETAPKDGTLIDLWFSGPHNKGSRQADCWWEANEWVAEFGRDGVGFAGFYVDDTATHWQPLPEPPTT